MRIAIVSDIRGGRGVTSRSYTPHLTKLRDPFASPNAATLRTGRYVPLPDLRGKFEAMYEK